MEQLLSSLLRVPAVAARLDTTEARVYELIRRGDLPAVRIGRQVRIDAQALEQWIEAGGSPLPGGWKREAE